MTANPEFFIGLDLGQSCDFTALAVLERTEEPGEFDPARYAPTKITRLRVRHVERIPLGTPYPETVARAGTVVAALAEMGRCYLIVDATGVGRPVVDLIRREGMDCRLWPVTITSGSEQRSEGENYWAPKRDLIAGLQVLLSTGELEIAAGMEWGEALVEEMAAMRVRVSERAREQYGAARDGEHDDLVLAVALACWGERNAHPPPVRGRRGSARDGGGRLF